MSAFGPAAAAPMQAAGGGSWELFAGAVLLGVVHGVEPGHGWPVAASYALDRSNKWFAGLAASLLLGVGHLVSSIAVVGVFFLAKRRFDLSGVSDPVVLRIGDGSLAVGSPMGVVAGVLLIVLGVREYRHGHSHRHGGRDHAHSHGGDHPHDHGRESSRHDGSDHHSHPHGSLDDAADRGLWGIASAAFVLGFAHEEEFEIIALCTGSAACLELMTAYALAVIGTLVALTLALIAGYYRFEERVERYAGYLPLVSAAVLVGMGVGFVLGLF